MRTTLPVLILIGLLMLMPSCSKFIQGDGQVSTHEMPVQEFSKLSIACASASIDYIQSDAAPALSVTTDQNIYEMLILKQEGDVLTIKTKEEFNNKLLFPSEFTITINSRALQRISLAGKAKFNLNGPFTAERLKINVAGAGTINLNDSVKVEDLAISLAGSSTVNGKALCLSKMNGDVAGSGRFNLKGTADQLSFSIAGKGRIEALELQATDISCSVAGYANMKVYATKSVHAKIAGFGRIKYKGNCTFNSDGLVIAKRVD